MHGDTVGSPLAPLRRFYGVRVLEFVVLPACIVPHGLARLLPKLRRDRHLRIDLALHLVLIKDPLDARGIARAHALVAGDARDARRGGALGAAAVLAYAGSHALDAELACIVAHAGIDPHGLAFVASAVVQVAGGECAFGAETVLALLHCRLAAGDDGALEVGVALDADLETAVPCLYAALLGDALVVAVDLAPAGIQSAADGHAHGADGEAATRRLVTAIPPGAANHCMPLSSQTVNEPQALRAALY